MTFKLYTIICHYYVSCHHDIHMYPTMNDINYDIHNVEAKYVTPLNIFQVKMKDIFYKHNKRLNPSVI